ncbi:histidine--tRNA ligase [Blattabacterium cuenoti]|uniref:histidine--tRNA ligase n=1 Tax=Blattabacterium cuenoti TaxID=1653831 RepID=UPI00163CBD94|nr:histidine--tRNA ligase [Blattabacterium cuenoti]
MEYPNIPKGTRDFSSVDIINRNFLIKIIKNHFKLFGFYPIETPSFENISTFTGKYGDEGDNLIFKILHSGNFLEKNISHVLKKVQNDELKIENYTKYLSNKALRYDLTVPFIRYVIMHKNQIVFPFKRYQIQPVWRAEKPQKGRYREFYQCDADIISYYSSLWEEIELLKLCDDIFTELNFTVKIYINHINILKGLAEIIGLKQHLWKDFITSLDKWDKIGKDLVKKEMIRKGIPSKLFDKISFILDMKQNFNEKEQYITTLFKNSENVNKGIKDLKFIFKTIEKISLKNIILEWNISLARGMSYYTGTIWEIFPYGSKKHFSIGGGGRYDLANSFGIKNISGIGISLGLDRIHLSMMKKNLFKNSYYPSKVLFLNFGEEEVLYSYKFINILRKKGISTQLYPNKIKISKQFRFANKNNIPFVIIIGKNEIKNKNIKIKDLKKGIEKEYDNINDIVNQLN